MRGLSLLAFLSLVPGLAKADVRLPALIGDHMVLQRDLHVPLWGTAAPGEEITVILGKQHLVTKADKAGHWRVELAPLRAGGPHTITFRGKNEITVRDVLVGEVWVCSGQSNMEWRVRQAMDPQQEAAAARYPKIRLFKVPRKSTPEPQREIKASWTHCTPATVRDFTAVGYFFGRELHRHLHQGLHRVPIGLIQSAWGGTRVEAWTSPQTLARTAAAKPVLERWDEILGNHPAAMKRHDAQVEKWKAVSATARKEGKRPPRRPRPPMGPKSQHRPSNLYQGMIVPLIPYAIRGAIWYQGESNASRAYQYRELFPALIRDWRERWDQGDFPFLFVQLANFKLGQNRDQKTWAELREAQTMTLSLPNTGMAVTIDIGNPKDIHPKNKQEVGRRLGLNARSRVFGEDIEWSGPMYDSMRVTGSSIVLRFKRVGRGLVAKGEKLVGFEIAGKDRKFFRAQARIEGETVVVERPDTVPEPVAVRYAWLADPTCNLFNQAGLPASPFRTDDWPGVTVDNIRP